MELQLPMAKRGIQTILEPSEQSIERLGILQKFITNKLEYINDEIICHGR